MNGAYKDDLSEIGRLMRDFRCKKSEDMYNNVLREKVHRFKKMKGGRARMSKGIEAYADEKATEAAVKASVEVAQTAKWSNKQIEDYLKDKYGLTQKEIDRYLVPAVG